MAAVVHRRARPARRLTPNRTPPGAQPENRSWTSRTSRWIPSRLPTEAKIRRRICCDQQPRRWIRVEPSIFGHYRSQVRARALAARPGRTSRWPAVHKDYVFGGSGDSPPWRRLVVGVNRRQARRCWPPIQQQIVFFILRKDSLWRYPFPVPPARLRRLCSARSAGATRSRRWRTSTTGWDSSCRASSASPDNRDSRGAAGPRWPTSRRPTTLLSSRSSRG